MMTASEPLEWIVRKPYALAHRAGCMDPDYGGLDPEHWTPGARWLANVADDVAEALRHDRFNDGADQVAVIHELADSAVPIHNYERWRVFVDLGAWNYDEAFDVGAWEGSDPTGAAGITLYCIARTLIDDLVSYAADSEGGDADLAG